MRLTINVWKFELLVRLRKRNASPEVIVVPDAETHRVAKELAKLL